LTSMPTPEPPIKLGKLGTVYLFTQFHSLSSEVHEIIHYSWLCLSWIIRVSWINHAGVSVGCCINKCLRVHRRAGGVKVRSNFTWMETRIFSPSAVQELRIISAALMDSQPMESIKNTPHLMPGFLKSSIWTDSGSPSSASDSTAGTSWTQFASRKT
jgi:hypothetical protein